MKQRAWQADAALKANTFIDYPTGQVQIWRVKSDRFGSKAAETQLQKLLDKV